MSEWWPSNGTGQLVPSPDVIATDLGDEAILLDPRRGAMYGLNAVGRRIWLALGRRDVDEVVAELCGAFDVDPERARADVRALVDSFCEAGLVRRADGAR